MIKRTELVVTERNDAVDQVDKLLGNQRGWLFQEVIGIGIANPWGFLPPEVVARFRKINSYLRIFCFSLSPTFVKFDEKKAPTASWRPRWDFTLYTHNRFLTKYQQRRWVQKEYKLREKYRKEHGTGN